MKTSTLKAIRTALQVAIPLLLWLAIAGPAIIDSIRSSTFMPAWVGSTAAVVVGGAAAFAKAWSAAETRFPQLRTWLTVDAPVTPAVAPPAEPIAGDPAAAPVDPLA